MGRKNVSGLNNYVQKKHEETRERILKTIEKMKKSKTAVINFSTVAKAAGVSKATLYNNAFIKERILSLRPSKDGTNTDGKIDIDREKQYKEQIKKLREDKENLISQLVEMEDIRKENERLKEQIKRLKGS